MAIISKVHYQGELRTECTHLKSGEHFITDAPPDNNGKGEAFSPTDLLATSLGACMVTIMGIKARDMGVNIDGIEISVDKIMASDPRRVAEIGLELNIPHTFDEKTQTILERAGLACPVAKSLHPDLKQNIRFNWGA